MSLPMVLPHHVNAWELRGNYGEHDAPCTRYDCSDGMIMTVETQRNSRPTVDQYTGTEYDMEGERQQFPSSDYHQIRCLSNAPPENAWAPHCQYYQQYDGHHTHNDESRGLRPMIQTNDVVSSRPDTVAYDPPTRYKYKGSDGDGNAPAYHQYFNYADAAVHHNPVQPPVYHQSLLQYRTVQSDTDGVHVVCGGANFSAVSHPARSPTQWDRGPNLSTFRDDARRRAKTFPEKLMNAYVECLNEDAVAWLPDGKSFVIVNRELFVREVLNKFFKATKYASFIRKLHRWGYVRLTSGTGTDCFHHPLFTINDPTRAAFITCAAPQHRQSVLMKNSENKPSLVGVERFIWAKTAADLPIQTVDGTNRQMQPPPSSMHLPHFEPSVVTSSSSKSNSESGESIEVGSMSRAEPCSEVEESALKRETANSKDCGIYVTRD